tara:strand:- start:308 stop:514 length:207 start_codon:yes stop_codon:yes gene_type:complete
LLCLTTTPPNSSALVAVARERAVALFNKAAEQAMGAGNYGIFSSLSERATEVESWEASEAISGLRKWK